MQRLNEEVEAHGDSSKSEKSGRPRRDGDSATLPRTPTIIILGDGCPSKGEEGHESDPRQVGRRNEGSQTTIEALNKETEEVSQSEGIIAALCEAT
mgnify:CR=1 FL=1